MTSDAIIVLIKCRDTRWGKDKDRKGSGGPTVGTAKFDDIAVRMMAEWERITMRINTVGNNAVWNVNDRCPSVGTL